jgi:hypothetical protein
VYCSFGLQDGIKFCAASRVVASGGSLLVESVPAFCYVMLDLPPYDLEGKMAHHTRISSALQK